MRMLTERGLILKAKIRAMGYRAIECYPGAAQDVWGLPRQHQDREALLAGLKKLGVRGLTKAATSDELDAATAHCRAVQRCSAVRMGSVSLQAGF